MKSNRFPIILSLMTPLVLGLPDREPTATAALTSATAWTLTSTSASTLTSTSTSAWNAATNSTKTMTTMKTAATTIYKAAVTVNPEFEYGIDPAKDELIEVRRVEAGDKYLARDGDSVKWIAKDDWFTEAPSPQAINAPQRQGLKVSRERGQTHVAISKWLRDKLVTIARSVTKEVDCGSDKPRYRRQMVACRRSEAAWIAGQLAKDRDVIGQLRSGAPQLLQAEGLNGTELADSEQVASFGPAGSAKFILAALGLESEIRSVQEAAALGFLARVVIGAAWRGREQAGNVPYKFRVLEPQIISVNKYKLLTYGERRLSGLPRTTFAGDKSSMVVKFCKEVEKSKKDKYSWVVDSNGDRVAPKSRTRRAEAKEEYETHTAELSWTPLKDNKGDECTRSCVDAYKWMAAGTCGEHGRPTDEAAEKASWTDTCGTYSWSVKTSE